MVILDFSLDTVDLTYIGLFYLNFDLIIFFETTLLVLIFVSVVYSTFYKLLLMLTVGVTRNISEPNRSHSKTLKKVTLTIISPRCLGK